MSCSTSTFRKLIFGESVVSLFKCLLVLNPGIKRLSVMIKSFRILKITANLQYQKKSQMHAKNSFKNASKLTTIEELLCHNFSVINLSHKFQLKAHHYLRKTVIKNTNVKILKFSKLPVITFKCNWLKNQFLLKSYPDNRKICNRKELTSNNCLQHKIL